MLEPLTKYSNRIRSFQVTCLVLLLGLFIPSECKREVATFLHRLRRRLVMILLNHFPTKQWTVIWAKRRWNYLGHLLRRPPEYLTRVDMLAMGWIKQRHPGPFHHISYWGCQLQQSGIQGLEEQASNREAWADSFLAHAWKFTHTHPFVHEACLPHWRDVFRTEVPWRLGVFLSVVGDRVSFTWLHSQEGMQTFSRRGSLPEVCYLWLCWLQFDFEGLLLDMYVAREELEAHITDVFEVHEIAFDKFRLVCSFNQVSRKVAERLDSLSV